jgi:hypothetical protein
VEGIHVIARYKTLAMICYGSKGFADAPAEEKTPASLGLQRRLVPKSFLQWLGCGPAGRKGISVMQTLSAASSGRIFECACMKKNHSKRTLQQKDEQSSRQGEKKLGKQLCGII